MARNRGKAREAILQAAVSLLRERGAGSVTVEAVATKAASAKGLVHYHFKTKQGLLAAAAERLAVTRDARWKEALEGPSLEQAIDRTWSLLTEESVDGTTRARVSLVGLDSMLPDQVARKLMVQLSRTLSTTLGQLLATEMDLAPTARTEELGWLLGVVIDGIGLQLLAGASLAELEGPYAAAWLGILSVAETRP